MGHCCHDDNDETDSKECIIQNCLNGSDTGLVDLTVLRQAACSPCGLCSMALRRQAWPKLVAAHHVLFRDDLVTPPPQHGSWSTATDSSHVTTKRLRNLVQLVRWSKHSPFARVESSLSLDLSMASPSLSLSPAPHTPQKHQHHTKKSSRIRKVSFEQDILANEEEYTLVQLLKHLQRCYPDLKIHQATADLLAVLWRVLELPSLTSITSIQLFQYHWQPLPDSAVSFFADLLEGIDSELYHHFQNVGGDNTARTPHCIQESWIPYWMSRDVEHFHLLARLWDLLLSSHPRAIIYFSVTLVVHYREALLSATQSPILLAILKQLPRQLDERDMEKILAKCISSMHQSPLAVDSYRDAPDWIRATTAPTDNQVLSTLRTRREAQLSFEAIASTNTRDAPISNYRSTPPETEDTDATDDSILAISPLIPSASYPTIMNILQQLEREGQRRRQLANGLKEGRQHERLVQLVRPTTPSRAVRLLPKTGPTPMAAWIEQQQRHQEDQWSHYTTIDHPKATPENPDIMGRPKEPHPKTSMLKSMDQPYSEMDQWTIRVTVAAVCRHSWWRRSIFVVFLSLTLIVSIIRSVAWDESRLWSKAGVADSLPLFLMATQPQVLLMEPPDGELVVVEALSSSKGEIILAQAFTPKDHVESPVYMKEVGPIVDELAWNDRQPDDCQTNGITVEPFGEKTTESPMENPSADMTPFLHEALNLEVSSSEMREEGTSRLRRERVLHRSLETLKCTAKSTGRVVRSHRPRTTLSFFDSCKMAGSARLDQSNLLLQETSRSTFNRSGRRASFLSYVAQKTPLSTKYGVHGGPGGVGRVTRRIRYAVAKSTDVALGLSISALRRALQGLESSRQLIKFLDDNSNLSTSQVGKDVLSSCVMQTYRELDKVLRAGKAYLAQVRKVVKMKGGTLIDATLSVSSRRLRETSLASISGIKKTTRLIAAKSSKGLDALTQKGRFASRLMTENGRTSWTLAQHTRHHYANSLVGASNRLSHMAGVTTQWTLNNLGHGARRGTAGIDHFVKAASRIIVDSRVKAGQFAGVGSNDVMEIAVISRNVALNRIGQGIRLASRGRRYTERVVAVATHKGSRFVARGWTKSTQLLGRVKWHVNGLSSWTWRTMSHGIVLLIGQSNEVATTFSRTFDMERQRGLVFVARLRQALRHLGLATAFVVMSVSSRSIDRFETASRIIVDSSVGAFHRAGVVSKVVMEAALLSMNVTLNGIYHGISLTRRGRRQTGRAVAVATRNGARFVARGWTKSTQLLGRAHRHVHDLSFRAWRCMSYGIVLLAAQSTKVSTAFIRTFDEEPQRGMVLVARVHRILSTVCRARVAAVISHGSTLIDQLNNAKGIVLGKSLQISHRVLADLRSHARLSKQTADDIGFMISQSRRRALDAAVEGALHVGDLLESLTTLPLVDGAMEGVLHLTDLGEALFWAIIMSLNGLFVSALATHSRSRRVLLEWPQQGLQILCIGRAAIVAALPKFKSRGNIAPDDIQSPVQRKARYVHEYHETDSKAWKKLQEASLPRMDGLNKSGRVVVDSLIKAKDRFIQSVQEQGDRVKLASSQLSRHASYNKLLSTAANQ